MKVLVVTFALVAVAAAQFDIGGISRQGGSASPVYGPPSQGFDERPETRPGSQGPEVEDYQPQTYRHVYVHAAPDEAPEEQARTIKIPGGDKHVNIIFVKTPSQSSQSETEIILPDQDEQKNLVYVLLKKQEAESNIKIRRPQNKQPQKPEVYFIRYKDQEEQQNGGGGYSQGPSAPAPPSQNGGYQRGPSRGGNGGGRAPPPTFDFDGPSAPAPSPPRSNGNGNGHHAANGNGHHAANGNGHHAANGNGHHTANGNGHQNGNGGYSEAGRYTPAVAPGVIRSQSDVPSSGYGVPL